MIPEARLVFKRAAHQGYAENAMPQALCAWRSNQHDVFADLVTWTTCLWYDARNVSKMGKGPLVTTQQHSAKTLDATAGDTFEIALWEDRTAGYSWTPRYDPVAFDLIDDDYQRTVNVDTADYGRRTFTFLAKTPGEHALDLEYRVGWKFSAGNRRQYLIRIRPGAPSSPPPLN